MQSFHWKLLIYRGSWSFLQHIHTSCFYCLNCQLPYAAQNRDGVLLFAAEGSLTTSLTALNLTDNKRMKVTIITFCLLGAVFANPISYNIVLESSELEANTTESLSVSQSSENSTSELQSSEENASNQSSEPESSESSSEETSEESDSQSDEDDGADSMDETRDNTMGSEENVRKSWVQVFSSVIKVLSAEDNSSAEVEGQTAHLSNEPTEEQPTHSSTSMTFKQKTNTTQGQTNLLLVENPTDSSDTTSDSADTSEVTATSDSSESTSSESSETSETSDSSDASKSTEDSNASDSTEVQQIETKDCVNGTQSCESEEYFFQAVGDDAHYSVDNLMVPDEDERELSLRR
ncbi:secretory calcium-binding phosphoprotein 1 [Trachinotus anak]|uniref:secretory calcium-binding phosphoprotein 1 n=1 Tax=Trachinotus anak TaxID=443729 RepID=UPI0039F1DC4D